MLVRSTTVLYVVRPRVFFFFFLTPPWDRKNNSAIQAIRGYNKGYPAKNKVSSIWNQATENGGFVRENLGHHDLGSIKPLNHSDRTRYKCIQIIIHK